MKRLGRVLILAALALTLAMPAAMPTAVAAVDSGLEGLWTGSTGGGRLTLLLGSGGTFISVFETDQTYREAGGFTTDDANMYLTLSDGTTSTLQYGFSEGTLSLSGDGLDAQLQRTDYALGDDLAGVWVVDAENGGSGLVAMDAGGGFASVDASTGETAKGIYLPDHGDLLVAYQDWTSMQMTYQLEASGDSITLTNPDSGAAVVLTRFSAGTAE